MNAGYIGTDEIGYQGQQQREQGLHREQGRERLLKNKSKEDSIVKRSKRGYWRTRTKRTKVTQRTHTRQATGITALQEMRTVRNQEI